MSIFDTFARRLVTKGNWKVAKKERVKTKKQKFWRFLSSPLLDSWASSQLAERRREGGRGQVRTMAVGYILFFFFCCRPRSFPSSIFFSFFYTVPI